MAVLDDYKYNTGREGGLGAASTIGGRLQGLANSVVSSLDQSIIRKTAAKLLGIDRLLSLPPSITWTNGASGKKTSGSLEDDWRVRVSVGPKSELLYASGYSTIMSPLIDTSGVIFPITPTIQVTHTAKYSAQSLTHSNYAMQSYESSEVGQMMINAPFPIQTIADGQYLLAALYFFRAATKMFWGESHLAGTPPPMVFLNGYGAHYFPNVPCVVTSVMHSLPDDVDYIDVPAVGFDEKTRLPTLSTLQVSLQPIYSRSKIKSFTLEEFAAGEVINKGFL